MWNFFQRNLLIHLSLLIIHSSSLTNTNRKFILPHKASFGVHKSHTLIRSLRGGEIDSDDEDDSEYDDESEDDDDDFDERYALDDAEDEFAGETTLSRALSAWAKTPPLTKAYLTASFTASAYGYLMNKNEFPPILSMDWKSTLSRLQFWRPLTAFLNVGPFGLTWLITGHFLWTYMSTLERLSHDQPYDFWILMTFGCISIVSCYGFLRITPKTLGHNLSAYLVYIWSRYHEGVEVNLFELFNTRAELLPWFFMGQTFLLEGELPILDFQGIVFGHIYHHCKTHGFLNAPHALVNWYNSDSAAGIREKYKKISADFEL